MGIGSALFGKQQKVDFKTDLPDMKDELKEGFKGLEKLYRSGAWEDAYRYGPYSAVPGMNQFMRQGFGGIQDMAGRNLGLGRGLQTMRETARGDYLYGNPGFDAAVDASLRNTIPAISSQFSGAGRTGSAYHANTLGQAASDAFAGQYGQERGRQLQAAGAIPGMAQAQFMPYQQMMGAGQQMYDMYQAPRARERVARHQMDARAPLEAGQGLLGMYRGLARGNTQDTSGGSMGFMGPALGTGLTLAGIFGGGGGFAPGASQMAQRMGGQMMGGYSPNPYRPWG